MKLPPRVHFKFPPPEFMNVNDQHYLADDTNSPKEWQKKKSAKEAKELAGSWCRELLQSDYTCVIVYARYGNDIVV